MKWTWRTALIALGLVVSACATGPVAELAPRDNRVEVVRQGERLHLTYEFGRDAAGWVFTDSALVRADRAPWRPRQWRVLTPGVELARIGAYDVLKTADGSPVPRRVEIEARPSSVDLEAEYRTLVFTTGAIGLPNRQVNLFPVDALDEVETLPADLNGVSLPTPPIEAIWRDEAGPVLFMGERFPRLITRNERSYVVFGAVSVDQKEGLTTVIDPALPNWMSDTLVKTVPAMGRWYREKLGPAARGSDRPTVMAAWVGSDAPLAAMQGSAQKGLITMIFEGRGIVEPDEDMRERALWFIAHETSHFWLGETVAYEYARDAWIIEGGADLLAVRALKGMNPSYDDVAELQTEVDDCVALAVQPVATANSRGEHRAYYACGAVFGMAAEAVQKAQNGGDFSAFVARLIQENREDHILTREEWLSAFAEVAGNREVREPVERLLDQGSPDPRGQIADLFTRTGVSYRMEAGEIVLTPSS